jgi:cytochrome P450/deferrochelatase/peroxidase EfeB
VLLQDAVFGGLMANFPEWARGFLDHHPLKVSHGLNLALKLKHPELMPLVLWDIVVARPVIQRALDGLSFIHFARFVPSWDGKALMVTTEFDGPLEPYVMDFAIAIGEVFDRLLSYTEGAPPLPVREHPDEFWRFVQEWNRVPFFPWGGNRPAPDNPNSPFFPPEFDYPLYSAYPGLSAIDIAGPHKRLPPPALNRPAAEVDTSDVQGNILRPYAAATARYLFLRVTNAALARPWLAQQAAPATAGRTEAWPPITDAQPWPRVADGSVDKPTLMLNVAFTFAGMKALLPKRLQDLERFPEAFRLGALSRAKDNGDIGHSKPDAWLIGKPGQELHVMLTLQTFASESTGGADWQRFTAIFDALQVAAVTHGLAVEVMHEAQAFLGQDGKPTGEVYFGYHDGIAQPRIAGQCPVHGGFKSDFQPAASPGEFLLGQTYADIFRGPSLGKLPPGIAQNGTYAALRLLEQDVEGFDEMLASQSAAAGVTEAELQARLMGRWANGDPLTLSQAPPPVGTATLRNDFDYAPSWEHRHVAQDHAGSLCPVGAHIRRTNPRSARVAGQPHARRLIRRGMPTHWQEDGTSRKGLLGLFICGSLERQFEFIQRQWIQGDLAASGIAGTQDPIAGQRNEPTEFRFFAGGQEGQSRVVKVPPLVTTRGSLYLFVPGMGTLRHLDAVNAGTWPPPAQVSVVVSAPGGAVQAVLQTVSTAADALVEQRAAAARIAKNVATNLFGVTQVQANSPAQAPGTAPLQLAGVAAAEVLSSLATLAEMTRLPIETLRQTGPFLPESVEATVSGDAPLVGLPDAIRKLLAELVLKGVQSEWFQRLIEAFAPPPPDNPASGQPVPGLPITELDPADAKFIIDPFGHWKQLRDAGTPVVWSKAHRAYWVLGHTLGRQVLSQPTEFVQQPSNVKLRGIITLDRPRHTVVRKAVEDALKVAAATKRVDGLVDDAVQVALRSIGTLQQFDAVPLFTNAVPAQVYWNVFGLPEANRAECAALARTLMLHFGQPEHRGLGDQVVSADASVRLVTRLALLLAEALLAGLLEPLTGRNRFKGTLIGELADRVELLQFPGGKRTIDFVEALLTLLQLVLAGFMSMQFLMGTALRNLLLPDPRASRGGEQPWEALGALLKGKPADFPAAMALALEEARRFDSPVTIVQRFAGPNGATLNGVQVAKDSAVFVVAGSANRDGGVVPDGPDEFHWDRPTGAGHLSLGHDIHKCVGQQLQARIVPRALEALLQEMPALQLVDVAATPAWLDNVYFRALQSLPVHSC